MSASEQLFILHQSRQMPPHLLPDDKTGKDPFVEIFILVCKAVDKFQKYCNW